jgi:hypothetical protein
MKSILRTGKSRGGVSPGRSRSPSPTAGWMSPVRARCESITLLLMPNTNAGTRSIVSLHSPSHQTGFLADQHHPSFALYSAHLNSGNPSSASRDGGGCERKGQAVHALRNAWHTRGGRTDCCTHLHQYNPIFLGIPVIIALKHSHRSFCASRLQMQQSRRCSCDGRLCGLEQK